jgi:hypothetical protein
MAQDNQNFVFGGLDTDTDLRTVKSDRYIDANDVEHFIDDQNTIGGIRPAKGTKLAYTIPNITPQINSYRIPFITTSSTDYKFVMYDKDNTEYNIGEFFAIGTNNAAVASIGSSLASAISALPNIGIVTAYTNTLAYQTVAVQEGGYRLDLAGSYAPYSIVCFTKPAGTSTYTQTPVITLTDAINYTAEMQPLASVLLGDYEYVLSKAIDQEYCEIGAATRDLNGNWTYTRIAGSEQFNLPTTEVISLRAELVGNDKVGLYWVDNTNKPKVFYVNVNLSISVFRYQWLTLGGVDGVYYNINGTYNLNNIGAQTDLQIFNNEAIVTVQRQIATGGKLTSGGKRYYVRFGVNGVENATPFNEIGEYTIVYKADNESPRNAVKIKGDAAAEVTTKQIVLNVDNCKADIFNFIELVCVEYIGGATTAILVGRYDITSETTTIIHNGFELNSQPFDVAGLPNVTPVILTAKVAEIKKNRYNVANTRIDGDSNDYATIAKNVTVSSGRKTINKVGNIYTTSGQSAFQVSNYYVNSIQLNSSPYNRGGYFYDTQGGTYTINSNPYSAFDTATYRYTATAATAGAQTIKFNFRILGVSESAALGNTAGTIGRTADNLNPFGDVFGKLEFARVVVSHNDSSGNLISTLYDETDNGSVIRITFERGLSLNVDMNAGEYITASWFVQGEGTWSIISSGFSSVLSSVDSLNFGKNLTENEYQKAENVANNMGYMLYEPYQYYIRFHKNSGYVTSPYYIGSHTITPEDFGDGATGTVRLTDASGNPYVYHPVFSNVDITNIKNDISGVSFWRGDITNPTVIACGVNLMCNQLAAEGYYAGFFASNPTGTTYGTTFPIGSESVRYYSAFLSPDNLYKDGELIKFQSNDKMRLCGQPTVANQQNNIISSKGGSIGSFIEFTGYCNGYTPSPVGGSVLLQDAQFTPFRQTTDRFIYNSFFGGLQPTKLVLNSDNTNKPSIDTPALALSHTLPLNVVADVPANQDYGVYVAYYLRENSQTDIININVVDCNSFFEVSDLSANILNNIDVFGGDVYTQKSYIRLLYKSLAPGAASTADKHESFISFYTQNRYNTQMRRTVDGGCVLFPADAKNIAEYLDDNNEDIYAIDEGYNEQNNRVTAQRPYNKNVNNISYFPSRIYYTAQRPTGSSYDSYRDIKPLDFKDLDGKNGQISSLYDVNDTMIAIQKYAVTVLPYQTDVLLRSDAGAEIYVGNGGVYAQRESIVSTYGTDVTTFAFRGYNNNGNASLYWFSEVVKKAFRYGRDGIRPISDDAKVRNFFLSRTKYLSGEFDLVMGFDTKRDVLWMTGFAVADTGSIWYLDTPYTTGDIVRVDTAGLYGTPLYYRALQDNTGQNPTTTTGYWEVIPTSDGDYYSIFTILYNEKLNAFTTERTVLPKRYFQYNNQLMVPSPYSAWGKVYEMNNGTDNTYFDGIEGEFFVQLVSNKIQNTSKRYISIGLNTGEDLQDFPTVDFETKLQSSTSTDFEQKNGNIWVAVEADANGEPLIGEYMKVRISSQNEITLLDAVSKIYYRPRLPR